VQRKIITGHSAKKKHGQNAQSINPTTHKRKTQTQHSTNKGHGRSIVQKKGTKTKQEDKKSFYLLCFIIITCQNFQNLKTKCQS
jgi:hypothetical protein